MQVGVRHFGFPSARVFANDVGLEQLSAQEFNQLGIRAAVERVVERIAGVDHVFWSFDIDCIDPSHAPGAGAHEPGGLTSGEALECVRLLASRCDGLVITEVNPMKDIGGMTVTVAAYLIFNFLVFGSERPAK
jgi:formiminoglutamase/agmatinase